MNIEREVELNPVLRAVTARLKTQTAKGIAKYGESVQAGNLTPLQWIEHAQQELTDALVYLECLKQTLKGIDEGCLGVQRTDT